MAEARHAHDLRQPLAAATLQAELLASRLTGDDAALVHLQLLREQLRLLAEGIDHVFGGTFGDTSPPAPVAPLRRGALAGAMVVVVDDDDAVRLGLETVLADAGAFVLAAASLAQARARLQGADRQPDLILTDWRFPGAETGAAVIHTLRSLAFGRELPAFVLTADLSGTAPAMAGLTRVELLRKPVSGAALVARLALHWAAG
jgi:CheY-like chemotaxis protein